MARRRSLTASETKPATDMVSEASRSGEAPPLPPREEEASPAPAPRRRRRSPAAEEPSNADLDKIAEAELRPIWQGITMMVSNLSGIPFSSAELDGLVACSIGVHRKYGGPPCELVFLAGFTGVMAPHAFAAAMRIKEATAKRRAAIEAAAAGSNTPDRAGEPQA